MISPLPGVTTTKPGSATKPFPGVEAAVLNEQGERVERGGGYLVLERPWPAMTRGIFGDDERFRETYWSRFPGHYFAGDGARIDADGDYWLLGRVDDVMNVSGHRLSTIEVESALVDHPRGRRGGRLWPLRRDDRPGDRRLRDAEGQRRPVGRDARGAPQPRREQDRRDREAGQHRLHARAPEDALGQDHAPPAARRRREPGDRRHHHAGRSRRSSTSSRSAPRRTQPRTERSSGRRRRGRTRRPCGERRRRRCASTRPRCGSPRRPSQTVGLIHASPSCCTAATIRRVRSSVSNRSST